MRPRDLLQKTDVPEGRVGNHAVEKFVITNESADFHMLRCIMNGQSDRAARPGEYTRLIRGEGGNSFGTTVIMSDTQAELLDHHEPVRQAHGHCLVNGLGLGIVTEAMLRKDGVERVTVVEYEPEVVELVGAHLLNRWGERLEIIEDDALAYRPPKGTRFGVVWHDIWDHICKDNLTDMKLLHRRYGHKADWQGSWVRERIDPNYRGRW